MKALSGKSEARGRNGWFIPTRIEVFLAESHNDVQPIVANIYSSHAAQIAPIVLQLSLEDAVEMAKQILDKVRAI